MVIYLVQYLGSEYIFGLGLELFVAFYLSVGV